ncbi:MAG: hypothetical protein AAFQ22_13205 [Pseudomonadota bacterium]
MAFKKRKSSQGRHEASADVRGHRVLSKKNSILNIHMKKHVRDHIKGEKCEILIGTGEDDGWIKLAPDESGRPIKTTSNGLTSQFSIAMPGAFKLPTRELTYRVEDGALLIDIRPLLRPERNIKAVS